MRLASEATVLRPLETVMPELDVSGEKRPGERAASTSCVVRSCALNARESHTCEPPPEGRGSLDHGAAVADYLSWPRISPAGYSGVWTLT